MSTLITPRTLSGFRDYLPALMLAREKVLQTARAVYRSYGFTPIDTPACESLDVLLGKGGDESDKLVYRVRSARGETEEMGLRFDLTVPFARFSAQYINELGTPFKRYAMGPVWRGERPGKGRYREFWQCDFDTIGTTSNAADIETALVINDLFTAIGFERFEVRINNRMLLNGVLEALGEQDRAVPILRAIDKLPKIERAGVLAELVLLTPEQAEGVWQALQPDLLQLSKNLATPYTTESDAQERVNNYYRAPKQTFEAALERAGAARVKNLLVEPFAAWLSEVFPVRRSDTSTATVSALTNDPTRPWERLKPRLVSGLCGLAPDRAIAILDFVQTTGSNDAILASVESRFGANERTAEGIRRLRELLAVAKTAGVPDGRIKIDLSIARGLDYYTGTIYETFLTDLPGIGSVCSGGRYDNLASKYTKQVLPGVGASLGLDRLIAAMEELKHPLITGQSTPAQVLVVNLDVGRLGDYQRIARALRAAGVAVEVYPDANAKKIGAQLGFAEKRGFQFAVIAGPAEFEQGVWKVKDLAKREERALPEAELVAAVRASVSTTR